MPKLGMRLVRLIKPFSILTVALAFPFAISAVPAQAQGIFGLFRAFSQPTPPVPPPQSFGYQPDPGVEQPRRKARPRPKPMVVEQLEIKKAIEEEAKKTATAADDDEEERISSGADTGSETTGLS